MKYIMQYSKICKLHTEKKLWCWLPAFPFVCLCLVSRLLVYSRSPLVSEILGDAQLLCEMPKQRVGSMPFLYIYCTGAIHWVINVILLLIYICVSECVCAHLLQYSLTTKLARLCQWLPRAESWLVKGGRGGRGDLPVRINRHSQ